MMVNFEKLPDLKAKSKVHTIEDHNYWIDRQRKCPYCLIGSKPVPKCLVVEAVK